MSDNLIAVSDGPKKGVCPWPIQIYTIRGMLLPTNKIPDFFDGDYMYEVRLLHDGVILNGFQTYLSVLKV